MRANRGFVAICRAFQPDDTPPVVATVPDRPRNRPQMLPDRIKRKRLAVARDKKTRVPARPCVFAGPQTGPNIGAGRDVPDVTRKQRAQRARCPSGPTRVVQFSGDGNEQVRAFHRVFSQRGYGSNRLRSFRLPFCEARQPPIPKRGKGNRESQSERASVACWQAWSSWGVLCGVGVQNVQQPQHGASSQRPRLFRVPLHPLDVRTHVTPARAKRRSLASVPDSKPADSSASATATPAHVAQVIPAPRP